MELIIKEILFEFGMATSVHLCVSVWAVVCFLWKLCVLNLIHLVMELFSLGDDDVNQLFITQRSNEKILSEENAGSLDKPNDFGRPCFWLMQPQHKDISDDNVEIPVSLEVFIANGDVKISILIEQLIFSTLNYF